MGLKPVNETFNPFPGLRPFREEECDLFFGREPESGEVLTKLLKNKFVTVIGASGCGKSSLINCGIIPGLKKLAENDESHLTVISFRPGNDPSGNVRDAFQQAFSASGYTGQSEVTENDRDPDWIVATLKKQLNGKREKVLIIVDQFEDLFSYSPAESGAKISENASGFLVRLENAINQKVLDIYIVIALRSDYIGECASLQGVTQLINNSNYLVPQLTKGNYKNVIEKSFSYAGAGIDQKLILKILEDIEDQPYPLIVLQHLIKRLFSYHNSFGDTARPLDLSDYNAVGTTGKAISNHADEAFEGLSDRGKDICRKLFKAITGRGSKNKGIRNPLNVTFIASIVQCSEIELYEVVEKFRSPSISFVLPYSTVALTDGKVIDIAYEGLIGLWGRLREWVEEETSSVGMYGRLSEISAMYYKGKTTLLRNPDLQLYVNWRENQKPTLKWAERYDPAFERAMVYLRASEKAALEDEKLKAWQLSGNLKRNRMIAAILGSAAIISLGLMLFAFVQKIASDKQRSEAELKNNEAVAKVKFAERFAQIAGKELAIADSSAAIATHTAEEAVLLKEISDSRRSIAEKNAAEARKQQDLANERSDSARKAAIVADMATRNAMEQKNEAIRKRMISIGKSMSLKSLQISGKKDLQSLLTYQGYLFNKTNGGLPNDADIFNGLYNVAKLYAGFGLKNFSGHEGAIKSIAFIPGKREFFTSGADGKVLRWDLDGKNQDLQVVYSGPEIINVLAVSPDAGWLACGGANAAIKMISVEGRNPSYDLMGHSGPVKSLIFSYDGKYLYSASLDGKVLKWDLTSKTSINVSGGMMQINTIDLSFDNKYIAGVTDDGKVRVWDPQSITTNFKIESEGRIIRTVRFKPDENKLAVGYTDGYLEIWDIGTQKKISETRAHDSEVNDIRFNSKLSQIATAGNDRTVRLWDINDMESLPIGFDDSKGFIVALDYSPDGQVIVTGTSEDRINLSGRPTYTDLIAREVRPVIARNFTTEEWRAYVGKDIEYVKTISETDFKIKISVIK